MAKVLRNNDRWVRPMTRGEARFSERLDQHLEDDYLCWFEVPVGKARRYTDFIIFHPARGLLFLEVKDWSLDKILNIDHNHFHVINGSRVEIKTNPIEQARECALSCLDTLKHDKLLIHSDGNYQGHLIFPWGYGAVFPNILRSQWDREIPEDVRDHLLPDRLVICKDEMSPSMDSEAFQEQLWNMFTYHFGEKLTLPQVERIRWHIFPNVRINQSGYQAADLFSGKNDIRTSIPDIVKVLDIQQEQLARSLGDGHRVVHGVAGSGKTLILGYRCHYLSQAMKQPILVLCFNKTLRKKLISFLKHKGVNDNVHVYHFHAWCKTQLQTYNADHIGGASDRAFERYVKSVIHGVERGIIPREQYGAVLIDEGHDFEADWLKLIVQMVNKDSDSLLLLYDDAQSIYRSKSKLNFSLSSVGINARGRTTILKTNYRNTREILQFAYDFMGEFLAGKDADDDHVPVVQPEASGNSGPKPLFELYRSIEQELDSVIGTIRRWADDGILYADMCVIFPKNWFGTRLYKLFSEKLLPFTNKESYAPDGEQVSILTRHSSKGLEYSHVILVGVGCLQDDEEHLAAESKLLYVGMTRAKHQLVVTAHRENAYTRRLQALA